MPDSTPKPVRAWCAVTPRGVLYPWLCRETKNVCWAETADLHGSWCTNDTADDVVAAMRLRGWRVVRVRVEVE